MVEKNKKDWRILEFHMPIKETSSVNDDFLIKGIAINETTTRNGITYIASELEKAAPSFRNKPILLDHENAVKNIVGRSTENVNFSSVKAGIEFEAKIMDSKIKEMINDGRITDVSIGASVTDLVENEDDNSVTAIGLEGLEISLVAVPGDPGANLANAISESVNIRKEIMMAGKEPVNYLNDKKEVKDNMAEEEQTQEEPTETPVEKPEAESESEEQSEEEVAEEKASKKLKLVEKELAKYKKAEERTKLKEELKKEIKKEMAEEVEKPETDSDTPVEEPKPVEDETKGTVGTETEEEESTEEGLVIEKADTGRGFQIYRDYDKDETGKFKRLSR